MSLTATFLAHEARTQLRSARYRVMAFIYIAIVIAPAVIVFAVSSRVQYAIGSAAYANLIDVIQPFLTTLLAMILSIDAVSRERDEGSFAVIALAPISATGYLVRRWLAVVALALPVTLAPPLIAALLAAASTHQLPLISAFAGGWLLRVVPVLLLMSAITIAFGTINYNAIVAMIATIVVLSAGVDYIDTALARFHRTYDGAGDLIAVNDLTIRRLIWGLRGWYRPQFPTDAAYPFRATLDETLPQAALLFGISAFVFAVATRHLRRTRRDLKPWRVRDDHPLRSFVKMANRWRDEYARDGGAEWPERVALLIGVACIAVAGVYLVQRDNHFIALADERYRNITESDPLPMNVTIAPLAARIRGGVTRAGDVHATTELTLRNDGTTPERHLCFSLTPGITIERITASRGRAMPLRIWQRLGITLDPPLVPGESRVLTFALGGAPGETHFTLKWAGDFAAKWRIYQRAKTSIELSDLSRSTTIRDVDEARMQLAAADLVPVPRYTPWTLLEKRDQFIDEAVTPPTMIDIAFDQPFAVAADSCGTIVTPASRFTSRCSAPLAHYLLFGGPLTTRSLGGEVTLAYIPSHAKLASIHAPVLTGSLAIADRAWAGLRRSGRLLFIERPAGDDDQYYGDWVSWMSLRNLGGNGSMQFIQEGNFRAYKPLNSGIIAASIIVNTLTSSRQVAMDERAFFRAFYETLALQHVGGKKSHAVIAAFGMPPAKVPLLEQESGYDRRSFEGVVASLEYRIGGDALIAGINDFAAGGPRNGTAKELFAAIANRAHVNLDRVYSDFIAGDCLPKLTLKDVTFARNGASWNVKATLYNEGTGEAFCPIALRTAQGSLWQTPRIDSGESKAIVFTTPHKPLTLQLDPERVCYRQSFVGAIESADYKGDE